MSYSVIGIGMLGSIIRSYMELSEMHVTEHPHLAGYRSYKCHSYHLDHIHGHTFNVLAESRYDV